MAIAPAARLNRRPAAAPIGDPVALRLGRLGRVALALDQPRIRATALFTTATIKARPHRGTSRSRGLRGAFSPAPGGRHRHGKAPNPRAGPINSNARKGRSAMGSNRATAASRIGPGEHEAARHAADTPKGTVWLYGHHAVAAALANPSRRLRRLLLTEEAEATIGQLLAPPWAVSPERVDRARLDQLLGRDLVHQGAALLADPLAPPSLLSVLEKPGHHRRAGSGHRPAQRRRDPAISRRVRRRRGNHPRPQLTRGNRGPRQGRLRRP